MLKSLFRGKNEERAIQATPWGAWPGESIGGTWAGSNVTNESAMQLLAVAGSVQLIVNGITTMPVDAYRSLPGSGQEIVSKPAWLEEPMPGMPLGTWLTQVLSSLLLDGNAFIGLMFEGGSLVELIPLAVHRVRVTREKGRKVFHIDGAPSPVPILHVPALMMAGSEVGYSPVEYARQSIGLGLSALEFGARFFGQGATTSGVIETPEAMNLAKAQEMARIYAKTHAGAKKAHGAGVLTGGAHWVATGVTNEQAQFLQTRQFTAAEIAGQMFLVDPTDLGIPVMGTSLTYGNLEQRNIRRLQVTFMPWIVRIEKALSDLLAKPRYVKFNVDEILRGDSMTRAQVAAIQISHRIKNPDEIRKIEDLPPIPDGTGADFYGPNAPGKAQSTEVDTSVPAAAPAAGAAPSGGATGV